MNTVNRVKYRSLRAEGNMQISGLSFCNRSLKFGLYNLVPSTFSSQIIKFLQLDPHINTIKLFTLCLLVKRAVNFSDKAY